MSGSHPLRRALSAAVAGLPVLALGACSAAADSGEPEVVTSFYPLQYVAERVVGEHAQVTNLTAPGVEPHDVELSPRQIARLGGADVVFHEKGLQPALDDALDNDRPEHVVDAARAVQLREAEDGTGPDPHFWLDPTLLGEAATAFTEAMIEADPEHADDYRAGNERLQQELTTLDQDIRAGLEGCTTRTIVVSHDAFGYFGQRYDLEVQPIAGLSPDAEPSVRHLAELSDLISTDRITTVFSETLASPKLADTLASDLGIDTAVLDPIEGLASAEGDEDYLSLMRENLAALRKAGGCR